MFLENTAAEKAQYMINKLLAYRFICKEHVEIIWIIFVQGPREG